MQRQQLDAPSPCKAVWRAWVSAEPTLMTVSSAWLLRRDRAACCMGAASLSTSMLQTVSRTRQGQHKHTMHSLEGCASSPCWRQLLPKTAGRQG